MSALPGTRILIGIGAGIAAYKIAQLARLLKQAGCEVRVVMTEGAQAFIAPMTFQALTGENVRTSLLDPEAEAGMGHIELARWADRLIIAPATADLMARLAHGMADDLLTTLCLASRAEKFLAPAMNQAMWAHPATARNARQLAEDGWQLLGPGHGDQACGDVGAGRMLEPEALAERLLSPRELPARGLRLVITAGPTREAIDPVRYLSNHSSGKMGYALAARAVALGADVVLISGPVALATPAGVTRIDVESASEMLAAAEAHADGADIFIGCAAVADYRAASAAEHKLKKGDDGSGMTLALVRNPDIIATIAARADRPFVIGFAAETRDLERYGRDKLTRKRLDMVVANDVSSAGLGFGADDNAAMLLWQRGDTIDQRHLPPQPKTCLADAILEQALHCLSCASPE
ncbi:bifunctional phosphopantothenoylcysteine decarboxylase/phosphopantothenate--cysteine ligase CoaBC [Halomonas sp. 18H]|uniref:bifunctional phosphopantothenoylcysteine decarboxylase/phosphopantothenate--cysteine ligase CoaBC n=1 Tax=Halomonas almeriensis TaxID=308163 RepID=UPI0022318728|nr:MULTISPECIES: bifunctional phosphopantothenoylcysteine decarboxylase/phosphopantothenate--cysteine ligase CoaBC [Halomonas]MCW4152486.1 bifunctional phosphopantothenoylcysteine decarboxylase/phosphopantothenate--cysteine ligase CoaBC [Halomonas sp. 18H]MDN3553938.1 bifunctional phosphopantothenoylcysteine decarboxylase/phosphopantothenate--cysteine ligase CoaBC [Halomonas almeriensis]